MELRNAPIVGVVWQGHERLNRPVEEHGKQLIHPMPHQSSTKSLHRLHVGSTVE
jgi:hypothetical protein